MASAPGYRRDHIYRVNDEPAGMAGNVPRATGKSLPVFDRGHLRDEKTVQPLSAPFGRNARDNLIGKPLPPEATGDPHPDRVANSDRLRENMAKRDGRTKIEGSVDRECVLTPREHNKGRSLTPIIETPRSYYVDIPDKLVKLEARRGDQVLRFPTVTEAARCLTGTSDPKHHKAIQNAAGGVTRQAFGWEWTRLASRRGANR